MNEKALAEFGRWCLIEFRQDGGCDLDGGLLQDKAEELGLLVRVKVDEPCCENCFCVEFHGDFPVECLRLAK